mmetsp:Transcript_7945/g.21769  ORF Transcript_7945/g.21769 Transcript_7945/m.21769 type:complete len:299 (+) Transcript_7945:148-1044(+)
MRKTWTAGECIMLIMKRLLPGSRSRLRYGALTTRQMRCAEERERPHRRVRAVEDMQASGCRWEALHDACDVVLLAPERGTPVKSIENRLGLGAQAYFGPPPPSGHEPRQVCIRKLQGGEQLGHGGRLEALALEGSAQDNVVERQEPILLPVADSTGSTRKEVGEIFRRRRASAVLKVVELGSYGSPRLRACDEQHVRILRVPVHACLHGVCFEAKIERASSQTQSALPSRSRHGGMLLRSRIQIPVRALRLQAVDLVRTPVQCMESRQPGYCSLRLELGEVTPRLLALEARHHNLDAL